MPSPHVALAADTNTTNANEMLPGEVRGLGFTVNQSQLLTNINLDLTAGTRTVIMGANGAGKSVLLRLLHGLLEPTTGTIRWGGKANGVVEKQCWSV